MLGMVSYYLGCLRKAFLFPGCKDNLYVVLFVFYQIIFFVSMILVKVSTRIDIGR